MDPVDHMGSTSTSHVICPGLEDDRYAVPAARAYAIACEKRYPALAEDLRARANEAEAMWNEAEAMWDRFGYERIAW